jgi:hypothetical protein
MRVQAYLTAAVLNLKKLLKAVFGRKAMAAIIRLNPGRCLSIAVLEPWLANALSAVFASHPDRRRHPTHGTESLI